MFSFCGEIRNIVSEYPLISGGIVRQRCLLSPTLFQILVNALANHEGNVSICGRLLHSSTNYYCKN